jgi:hypothetical protein
MNEVGAKNMQTLVEPFGGAGDQAVAAGKAVQQAAAEFASSSAEALKGHASHVAEAAKDVASEAQERLQDKIAQQKGVGADYVNNLADTMRRAATLFDSDMPVAGTYIRKAAVQMENAADAVRNGDFNDLVQGAQRFARNQPTAFFGLAFLAGFGVVRFLRSASGASGADRQIRASSNDSSEGLAAPDLNVREHRRSM